MKKHERYGLSIIHKYSAFENCVNLEKQIKEAGGEVELAGAKEDNVTC